MNVPDPVTTGVVTATALQAAKQAQDFISAAAGRPGESLGAILGGMVHRRLENVEAVGNKAHLILLNIGVKPAEVPLNVLQPALDGASLQEDEYLRETWANLLANAADPRKQNPVSPVFSGILKELTGADVKFLDMLSTRGNNFTVLFGASLSSLQFAYQKANGLPIQETGDFQFSIELLERNQIIAHEVNVAPVELGRAIQRVPRGSVPNELPVKANRVYRVTTLGARLIAACHPPTQEANSS